MWKIQDLKMTKIYHLLMIAGLARAHLHRLG